MDGAPAVEVPVGGDAVARGAMTLLVAAAAASMVAWAASWAGASSAWGGLAGGFAAALSGWALARRRPRWAQLRWDGRVWSLVDPASGASESGRTLAAIDLDAWMLLRFDGDSEGTRRWIALSRSTHCASWHAVRCALYSRRFDADPLAATRT
jgi:hypothetical protein